MTVPRALFVLFLLVALGVAVVGIRQATARTAARVQKLHQRKIRLVQKQWAKELELAKLRGPEALSHRAAKLGIDVLPPSVYSSSQ